MSTNNEFNISISSNDVFGASNSENQIIGNVESNDRLDSILCTSNELESSLNHINTSMEDDVVPGLMWDDEEDDSIIWEDGPIVREDNTIVINLPSYTLVSGDEIPLPVALWGEKNIISENFVFDTAMWLEKIQDEAYMEHKYSSNSHYLYEPSEELTIIVNDSLKIIVDVVEKLYGRRYDKMVLREIFIKLKLDKDYTTEMAVSHLKEGIEVGRNRFIDWSRVNIHSENEEGRKFKKIRKK